MRTSRYPIWKSILEFIAIVAYVPVTTYLCYAVVLPVLSTALRTVLHPQSYADMQVIQSAIFSVWVGLIAAGAWVLLIRGRKAAGWIMAAAAIIAAWISYVLLNGILPGI